MPYPNGKLYFAAAWRYDNNCATWPRWQKRRRIAWRRRNGAFRATLPTATRPRSVQRRVRRRVAALLTAGCRQR
jgi:hypothetical protein